MSHGSCLLRDSSNSVSRYIYKLNYGKVENVAEFQVSSQFLRSQGVDCSCIDFGVKRNNTKGETPDSSQSLYCVSSPQRPNLNPGIFIDYHLNNLSSIV